jgi:hypothetical protein
MARRAIANLTDFAASVGDFGQDAGGAGGQGAALRGQSNPSSVADMDRVACDPLNLGQEARCGRLGDANGGGGCPDLAGLGKGRDDAQMAKFQAAPKEDVCH